MKFKNYLAAICIVAAILLTGCQEKEVPLKAIPAESDNKTTEYPSDTNLKKESLSTAGAISTTSGVDGKKGSLIATSEAKKENSKTTASRDSENDEFKLAWDNFVKAYSDFQNKIKSSPDNANISDLNQKGSDIVHKAFVDALKMAQPYSDPNSDKDTYAEAVYKRLPSELRQFVKFDKIYYATEAYQRVCILNLTSPKGFGYYSAVYYCLFGGQAVEVPEFIKVQTAYPNPMSKGQIDSALFMPRGDCLGYIFTTERKMQDSKNMPNFFSINVYKSEYDSALKENSWKLVKEFELPMSSPESDMHAKISADDYSKIELSGDGGKLRKTISIDDNGNINIF